MLFDIFIFKGLNANVLFMKKIICFILLLTTNTVFAQWTTIGNDIYNTNTSNVGIGTIVPQAKLHVAGPILNHYISLDEGNGYVGFLGRGGRFTSGWASTPDILALTYFGRDFAIGGWGKSDG